MKIDKTQTTLEVDGMVFLAIEAGEDNNGCRSCTLNQLSEAAVIDCKDVPCQASERKDGRDVYFRLK